MIGYKGKQTVIQLCRIVAFERRETSDECSPRSAFNQLTGEKTMKRLFAILSVVFALSTLTACGTLAGTAIGGGIGSTQGKTGEGMAIGAGLGMIYDITR
jgi:hypothetical protein